MKQVRKCSRKRAGLLALEVLTGAIRLCVRVPDRLVFCCRLGEASNHHRRAAPCREAAGPRSGRSRLVPSRGYRAALRPPSVHRPPRPATSSRNVNPYVTHAEPLLDHAILRSQPPHESRTAGSQSIGRWSVVSQMRRCRHAHRFAARRDRWDRGTHEPVVIGDSIRRSDGRSSRRRTSCVAALRASSRAVAR